MRYIKRKTYSEHPPELKEWEQAILDAMQIKTFFVCKQIDDKIGETLCYLADEAFLENFNEEYKEAYDIIEVTQNEVRAIVESLNIGFTCTFDLDGKITVIEDDNLIEQIEKNKIKEKPYDSWIFNEYTQQWQPPQPHPLRYQGEYVYIKSLNKVVRNPNYDNLIWDEESLEWTRIEEDNRLIYLDKEYMWEFFLNTIEEYRRVVTLAV